MSRATSIHVGTAGWTYGDWNGVFYPAGVRGGDRLSHYAERFGAVEVNATFYRHPSRTMIDAWNRRLPPEFQLVVKGHRKITHERRLAEAGEASTAFLESVAPLATLRVVLWQLPPFLRRDVVRLEAFLASLAEASPGGPRHAVEFRHPSWWHDSTAAVLERHRAAFVTLSHPQLPGEVMMTTDFLYVRFHGQGPKLYDYAYSRKELAEWAERLRVHATRRSLYAFFNNTYHGHAPRDAATFRELVGRP